MSTKAPWPDGVARHVLTSVDSTNSYALAMAAGLSGPAWVLGLVQTAGRGRRARSWASPRGNFHGSLVMAPFEPAGVVALRSFAAALALREALVAASGLATAFQLKWPNDVLLNGGKVAGILLESIGNGAGVAHLAIGFGVNLIAAPDQAELPPEAMAAVSVLAETGVRITPEAFLDLLAPCYAGWEARFVTEGFAPLRAEWLKHAAKLGETISARTGTISREGVFEAIDAAGNLILRTTQGPVAIPAAEVFF